MSETAEKIQERKGAAKGRSPAYPGIDLGAAITRAEELYAQERQNPAHVDTILRHWGYNSPKSGNGRVAFAALKKFGLITEEGGGDTRRGRLSELALRIIQDQRPSSPERQQAIQLAALRPAIHRELWDHYQGSLPSDENLRFTLLRERNFTETGATEFIQEFRATIEFARLGERVILPPEGQDSEQTSQGGGMDQSTSGGEAGTTLLHPPPDPKARAVQLPLGAGKWATLQAPFPFSEQDWSLMLAVLQAMKPGLVAEPAPQVQAPLPADESEDDEPEDEDQA